MIFNVGLLNKLLSLLTAFDGAYSYGSRSTFKGSLVMEVMSISIMCYVRGKDFHFIITLF